MAHIAIWRRAFPDLRGTVLTRRVLSDGRVYLKVIWQGTHAGPLKTLGETIPASNRHIIVPSELFIRVRDGQVVETSHLYDREALLRQIGAPQ